MGRLTENSVVNIKNKSHSVTAQVVVPEAGAHGRDHRPGRRLRRLEPVRPATAGRAYCYNLFGLQRFKVYGDEPIPAGEHQVRMEFAYDGGGLGKGGTVTLYRRRRQGRRGPRRGDRSRWSSRPTRPPTSAATARTPVSDDYGPKTSAFTGRVRWVQIDLGRRRPRPPHHPGGAPARRHGPAVGTHSAWSEAGSIGGHATAAPPRGRAGARSPAALAGAGGGGGGRVAGRRAAAGAPVRPAGVGPDGAVLRRDQLGARRAAGRQAPATS